MYDFCFSPIYSVFLALAGAYIYFTTGSKASFGGAVGAAVILGGLAYGSLKYYIKHKAVCKPTVFLSLVVAAGLTSMMYKRFEKTHSVPAAAIGVVSGGMALFYAWSISPLGPKPGAHAKAH
ncbi:hypothetical protein HYH02_013187 [Chlamydomonas schloesseri]|uniref:Transmembrane protein 14 n=1 Tax=Chlamydomonas schloesseri TaxID=2026947 RepID=A0A835SUA0_9CHLO|nr:hypothetical protein HYH02_013187 [Chlamydomonas schloesseri]|eukprot:KAG2431971.1 hypothetical protein HYH02_013187 [Chlamydomonas schloesseri]